MNINDKLINVGLSYKIYLEKEKAFKFAKKQLNNDLKSVCSHFVCNNCPVLDICVKAGRLGDEY